MPDLGLTKPEYTPNNILRKAIEINTIFYTNSSVEASS